MKKVFLIASVLVFTAASCNSILFGGTGAMGVFRSEDLGDNFGPINTIDRKNNLNSTSINSIVFDPTDTNILFAASASGVHKTQDAGGSWKLLVGNILVADLAIDRVDHNIWYAAGVSNDHGKIISTIDGGASWRDLYTEPTTSTLVRSIAIDPNDSRHILAGFDTGEIIESYDSGTTWQAIMDLQDQIWRMRFGPNRNLYVLTPKSGLFLSHDRGQTFTNVSASLINAYIDYNSEYPIVSKFLDMAFDERQPGVIYLATQEGLVRTTNDGGKWAYVKMPVRDTILRTSAVGVNPKDSNNLYAVVSHTMFRTSNGGITWETKPLPTGQEVRQILIDPNSPNVIYLGLGVSK